MAFHKIVYATHSHSHVPHSPCHSSINLSSLQFMNSACPCLPLYTHFVQFFDFIYFFLRIFKRKMTERRGRRGRQRVEGMQRQLRCHQLQQLLKCRHNLCEADIDVQRIGKGVQASGRGNGQKLARQFTRPLV